MSVCECECMCECVSVSVSVLLECVRGHSKIRDTLKGKVNEISPQKTLKAFFMQK